MKLYDIPKGSRITGLQDKDGKDLVVVFDHLDGMYSYCWIEGHEDQVVHLSASTPLRQTGDNTYEIDDGPGTEVPA